MLCVKHCTGLFHQVLTHFHPSLPNGRPDLLLSLLFGRWAKNCPSVLPARFKMGHQSGFKLCWMAYKSHYSSYKYHKQS